MKIPENMADQVIGMDLQSVYAVFILLDGEYPEFANDYNLARYGIEIEFDIYWAWKSSTKFRTTNDGTKMIINGKRVDIGEYRTELENRRVIMTKAIIENADRGEKLVAKK